MVYCLISPEASDVYHRVDWSPAERPFPHIKTKLVPGEEQPVAQCPECGRVLLSLSACKIHILRVHWKLPSFLCGICKQQFLSREDLTKHAEEGRNRYRTLLQYEMEINPDIQEFYAIDTELIPVQNKIELNEEDETYQCKLCPRKFHLSLPCQVHINSSHLGMDIFVCLTCSLRFKGHYEAQAHVYQCAGITRGRNKAVSRSIKCSECKATFPWGWKLLEHIKDTHKISLSGEVRLSKCSTSPDQEQVSSVTNMDCSSHWLCRPCGLNLAQDSAMGSHLLEVHDRADLEEWLKLGKVARIKHFKCSYCLCIFSQAEELRQHKEFCMEYSLC